MEAVALAKHGSLQAIAVERQRKDISRLDNRMQRQKRAREEADIVAAGGSVLQVEAALIARQNQAKRARETAKRLASQRQRQPAQGAAAVAEEDGEGEGAGAGAGAAGTAGREVVDVVDEDDEFADIAGQTTSLFASTVRSTGESLFAVTQASGNAEGSGVANESGTGTGARNEDVEEGAEAKAPARGKSPAPAKSKKPPALGLAKPRGAAAAAAASRSSAAGGAGMRAAGAGGGGVGAGMGGQLRHVHAYVRVSGGSIERCECGAVVEFEEL